MVRQVIKKRQTTEAHDQKRKDILEHCAALFDKVGYQRASMQMLADEVGVGKPTLYHYFRSKQAILYTTHEAHLRVLLDQLDEHATHEPLDRLRLACIDILRQIAEHPGYVRAFMSHYEDLEGKLRTQIRAQRKEYFDRIQGIIVLGIERGLFRDCDPAITTYGFLGMCNWAYHWYPTLAKSRPPEDLADALCRPFFEGLKEARS
jgi:AcrR family transcriptional regulator